MISGPWAWSNLEKSGIDFGVAPLPKVGEKRAKPLFGVTAAMINAASPNDFLATEFLEGYLLDEEGLRTFNSDGSLGAVAHRAYQAELGENPNIAGTLANAEIGDPMPNIPEMGPSGRPWSRRWWYPCCGWWWRSTCGGSGCSRCCSWCWGLPWR